MNTFGAGLLALPLLLLIGNLNAVTLVEMKDNESRAQRFYIGDEMARWDTDDAGGYMLIEMNGTKVYSVDPRDQTISIIDTATFSGEPVKSSGLGKMKHMGSGPDIAGFATEKYQLSAAGMHCADVYLSKSAFNVKGMREMWGVMADMSERASAMASNLSPAQDPCDQADATIMDKLGDLGMPMRSVDKNGVIETEVTLVNESANTPDGFFSLPKDYRQHDMNQQMQLLEQMNSQLPSPEKMMNMTEEEHRQMIIDIMGK